MQLTSVLGDYLIDHRQSDPFTCVALVGALTALQQTCRMFDGDARAVVVNADPQLPFGVPQCDQDA